MEKIEKVYELKEYFKVSQLNPLVEGVYRISLTAKKIFLCVVAQIEPEDSDFKYYTISISDFREMAGIKKNANCFTVFKNAVSELRKKSITIVDPETKDIYDIPFASTIKYSPKGKYIGYSFPPELKPFLLNLKDSGNFTIYSLGNIMKIRSIYSIRIYELLKQYRNMPKKERTFELEDLKKKVGVEDGKLTTYNSFKERVLEPAKSEIPQKTDIWFDYFPKKEGRKVVEILFTFGSPKDYENPKDLGLPNISADILNAIPLEYRNDVKLIKNISSFAKKKGEMYVYKNITYVLSRAPNSFKRYLELSLENDWAKDAPIFPQINAQQAINNKPTTVKVGQFYSFDKEITEYEIVENKELGTIGFWMQSLKGDKWIGKELFDGWIADGRMVLINPAENSPSSKRTA